MLGDCCRELIWPKEPNDAAENGDQHELSVVKWRVGAALRRLSKKSRLAQSRARSALTPRPLPRKRGRGSRAQSPSPALAWERGWGEGRCTTQCRFRKSTASGDPERRPYIQIAALSHKNPTFDRSVVGAEGPMPLIARTRPLLTTVPARFRVLCQPPQIGMVAVRR